MFLIHCLRMAVFYNFMSSGNHRTTDTVGRGGARHSTFSYKAWLTEYDGEQVTICI